MRTSGQALLRVLNQVLDLSKIEAGRMELAEAPFSPRLLMADAVDLVRPRVGVEVRHNGREVVDAWQDGAWDAVLMDCQPAGYSLPHPVAICSARQTAVIFPGLTEPMN